MKNNETLKETIQLDLEELRHVEGERLLASLDMRLVALNPSKLTLRYLYTVSECDLNIYNGVHGGIVACVIDQCTGASTRMITDKTVTTTEMSISFLKALTEEAYYVDVEFTKVGKRLLRMWTKVSSKAGGELVATAMSSYMVL